MTSPTTLLDEAIRTLADALGVKPIPASGSPAQEFVKAKRRDFTAQAMRRAQLLAASLGREVCSADGCAHLASQDDDLWCFAHWPDEVAIERAMKGEQVALMPHERTEAIHRMHRAGRGWNEIQAVLRVSGNTISTALAHNAQEAAA